MRGLKAPAPGWRCRATASATLNALPVGVEPPGGRELLAPEALLFCVGAAALVWRDRPLGSSCDLIEVGRESAPA
eukprot:CAMPEP_0177587212 /NCGR_PEP_ID=MMETSP0419_2-20121207/5512_1 /TAXON_ID=582737 /ORGANISM="Tetraselmis sp., Strain GSL018" /LENGTH=74 /DNA_ID=CAMNT_0019077209 /DNA_START=255 /DNA_END=479 /DNA_ORIENTATION=-